MGVWMIGTDDLTREQTIKTHEIEEVCSDSDDVWVALQRNANRRYLSSKEPFTLSTLGSDPLSRDIRRADFKLLRQHLQKSYARRGDTWIWSLFVFTASALVLVASIGLDLGLLFALFTCLCWTVVHRVRRL